MVSFPKVGRWGFPNAVGRNNYIHPNPFSQYMEKNNYLTRREQLVFDIIKDTDIISIQEIEDIFGELSQNMRYKILSSLNLKGYLYRLEKGLYLVQKIPSKEPIVENPYRIALGIFKGYIAFSSALRLYDLIEYEPFTIFVVMPNKFTL